MRDTSTFAELFDAAQGTSIRYQGRELHATYDVAVSQGQTITLRFLRSTHRPVQGVGIACHNCQIAIGETEAKNIALWTDTAPADVVLTITKAKSGARVTFVNQWRDEKFGSTMYRLNNAAMEILPGPNGLLDFRCSDGWGAADFNDLIFQLQLGE